MRRSSLGSSGSMPRSSGQCKTDQPEGPTCTGWSVRRWRSGRQKQQLNGIVCGVRSHALSRRHGMSQNCAAPARTLTIETTYPLA